jgi:hypothetical protein
MGVLDHLDQYEDELKTLLRENSRFTVGLDPTPQTAAGD